MPSIMAARMRLYRCVFFWYNFYLKEVHLDVVGAKDPTMPVLLIGYEGVSAYNAQREAHWFFCSH